MKKNKKELASMETIEKLIAISRRHFTQNGYSKTSLEAIAEEVQMTRGALYHHFKNKKTLFLSVLKKVQQEVAENVEKSP
ncbi:TetR/AcrR family transcriptional regulator [Leptotrichia sp. OH3620_COT-345]|uniref:TetR/AcrR family transcriptional regulator n=1 Tax=Leptotrichia sp. OH3620_COT-345 TaxID=2491048 RepID=UPI0018F614F6|nr:TetR/AcrR family transcriptional regulator [Leptotrichia sp. OH3620_COT-345]